MQINIAKSQQSQIKSLLYPEVPKPNKNVHKKNLVLIKQKQEQNRQKRYEKENFVERTYKQIYTFYYIFIIPTHSQTL